MTVSMATGEWKETELGAALMANCKEESPGADFQKVGVCDPSKLAYFPDHLIISLLWPYASA